MKPPELAVIIPTFNERPNIQPLLARLERTLEAINWEVIFVDDDSTDGTVDEIRAIALVDSRVRCLHRVGRRGLSSATIEGLCSTQAPYLAVMDADLQHDESLLCPMLENLQRGKYDLIVGSRYISGGEISMEWGARRQWISRLATRIGQSFLRINIADPLSGFFMLHRQAFRACVHRLSGRGFKILLDLIASSPGRLRVLELPYTFSPRQAGQSKLDSLVALEFGTLILDKLVGDFLPFRFVLFVLAGCVGGVLHLAILGSLHRGLEYEFWLSQAVASICAMVLNFVLNNLLTYRERRLVGLQLVKGLVVFIFICSIGAFTNVRVAAYLFAQSVPWWLAGLIGAGIGAVWNYAVSAQYVWRLNARDERNGSCRTTS
jgi:dolichol-phosphate mannosyltransferase